MKKLILSFFTVVLIAGCNSPGLIKQNEVIATSFVKNWTKENFENLAPMFSEDCRYFEMPSGRTFNSREEIRNYASATLWGMPDTKTEVKSVIADENMAAVEWVMSGTNTAGWPNIPASGKSCIIPIVSVMEIENGLIVENRDYWDHETFINAVLE